MMMMLSGVANYCNYFDTTLTTTAATTTTTSSSCSSLLCFISPSSTVGSSCKIRNNIKTVTLRKLSNIGVCIPKCSGNSSSNDIAEDSSADEKASFGYSRKDVILIGVGVTALGVGLKSGLEFVGVDPLQAGNVVQLVIVLGMIVGWISTYMIRVASKDMTYAKQLRDYESKVMEKRLEGLTEAELQVLLEQVEEEKRANTKQV